MSVWCLNIEFRGHSHSPLPMAETMMRTVMTMMQVVKMIKYKFVCLIKTTRNTKSSVHACDFVVLWTPGTPYRIYKKDNL